MMGQVDVGVLSPLSLLEINQNNFFFFILISNFPRIQLIIFSKINCRSIGLSHSCPPPWGTTNELAPWLRWSYLGQDGQ